MTLSARAQTEIARLALCGEIAMCIPANENAGAAWFAADADPYMDDHRRDAVAATRIAKVVAPEVERALVGSWRVHKNHDAARIEFRTYHPASRATRRREKTLAAMLPLAGFSRW